MSIAEQSRLEQSRLEQTRLEQSRREESQAHVAAEPALLNMDQVKVDPAWALRVPAALAVRRQVLPFAFIDGRVHVACADTTDATALQAVERFVGNPVSAEAADPVSLKRVLNRVFGRSAGGRSDGRGGDSRVGDGPVRITDLRKAGDPDSSDAVALCDELLYAALVREASDIHIDAAQDHVLVRLRVDGVLETYRKLPQAVLTGLVSRFKVLGGMDIAEKRAPQDGRFTHQFGSGGQSIDIRVASLPTKHGERMTLRLLALQTESLTVERLGMRPCDLDLFERAIARPHGMILLTGPTGSGKTTTLYAALRRLIHQRGGNIITIEDPIEYNIPGVAQVEVDSADKISFGRALRSTLRHDPDIVMIGEIRDQETADVAIKASLTGHLVFSTLHTNSAASVVTRLADMGVERFLIGATMRLAVAQRLVRRLCVHCRRPRPLATDEAAALNRVAQAGVTVYDPVGCLYCANRGYVGRLGLFELFATDEELSGRIAQGCNEAALIEAARSRGIGTLVDDAFEKLLTGETSVPEVLATVTAW
ncbi:MAG TPA: GspE/PulE family protein [Pirellulales bacterium]|nr:GspE/PulE family protein [Pirellulales bacterium]